jgi:hypothetical protein
VVTQSSVDLQKINGPSGFIEYAGAMLVVDYGKVYQDATPVGFLFEDGYLKDTSGPLGLSDQLRPIEALPGLTFRGIDTSGLALNLPLTKKGGPTGEMTYNGVRLHVVNGRLATLDHRLVGGFGDDAVITLRDIAGKDGTVRLDETTQLNTLFQGSKSDGQPWTHEFNRQPTLYRKDRTYADNEIIRYFMGFDALTTVQKRYVLETMSLWAASGILQVVRKSEGDASLGNIKHGAAGVTAVRTGNATFDKEEFNRDVVLYNQRGAHFNQGRGPNLDLVEVRLSLVVPHEFGHQLEFTLTQAAQDHLTEMYNQRRKACDKVHALPPHIAGYSEFLRKDQVERRHFVSGYSKSSMHEYWAECVAAFSVKGSREILRQFDPEMHELLARLVVKPQSMLRIVLHETIAALQASLKLGGEYKDDLLS